MHGARLHKTSRRDTMTRDEIYWAETETLLRDREETRDASVRDRDVQDFVRDETESLVRLETVSRPRRLDRDHIPGFHYKSMCQVDLSNNLAPSSSLISEHRSV